MSFRFYYSKDSLLWSLVQPSSLYFNLILGRVYLIIFNEIPVLAAVHDIVPEWHVVALRLGRLNQLDVVHGVRVGMAPVLFVRVSAVVDIALGKVGS